MQRFMKQLLHYFCSDIICKTKGIQLPYKLMGSWVHTYMLQPLCFCAPKLPRSWQAEKVRNKRANNSMALH
jgi:hypothetical protein